MRRIAIKTQTIVVFAYVSFHIKNNVKQLISYGGKTLQNNESLKHRSTKNKKEFSKKLDDSNC